MRTPARGLYRHQVHAFVPVDDAEIRERQIIEIHPRRSRPDADAVPIAVSETWDPSDRYPLIEALNQGYGRFLTLAYDTEVSMTERLLDTERDVGPAH